MADSKHIKIIKRGVKSWNEWRRENPTVSTDLSEAWLDRADLREANFYNTDLRKAKLSMANFYLANLAMADLEQADLQATDFRHSDLRGANLSGAHIAGALFNGALLHDTNFSEALIRFTTFGNSDLSVAKGLDSVIAGGPCTVGIDAVYLSNANIPEIFLKKAGVSDEFITYMKSLVITPIQFYSCFISYASGDQAFAERIYADFQNRGVRCWFAPENLKTGDKFRFTIDETIRVHDKLLLVLSAESISSQWVEKEVETALESERERNKLVLFPLRLDGTVMEIKSGWPADIRRTRHIANFTNWKDHDSYQKAFEKLVTHLKA